MIKKRLVFDESSRVLKNRIFDDNFRNWYTQRHEPYLGHETAPASQTWCKARLKQVLLEYLKIFLI